jgi:deazaflavin-dependent oxidoreductase (nitroreductase family)
MNMEWPTGFEKKPTMKISTIGRKTGRPHQVTVQFVVDKDGRMYIITANAKRDWVRNVHNNPSVEVTIAGVTRIMKAVPLPLDEDQRWLLELYRKKYLVFRLYTLIRPRHKPPSSFELKPD